MKEYSEGHCGITHVDRGALAYFKSLGCSSMLDIGCGPGGQVELAVSLGYKALGIDGDWELLQKGSPRLLICDFRYQRVQFPFLFDLVWCVEVAEHIEPQCELNLLCSVFDNASRFVVMTASHNPRPKGHINVKPRRYWIEQAAHFGWIPDLRMLDTLLARSTMKREFLVKNGMMFRKST